MLVRRYKRVLICGIGALAVFLIVATAFIAFYPNCPFSADPTLWSTDEVLQALPEATLSQRIQARINQNKVRQRARTSGARFTDFNDGLRERPPLKWFLTQASVFTGRRYFIEDRLTDLNMDFTLKTPLLIADWVPALEAALLHGSHQVWNNGQRLSQRLVLLRYQDESVLILSPEKAEDYLTKYRKLELYLPITDSPRANAITLAE